MLSLKQGSTGPSMQPAQAKLMETLANFALITKLQRTIPRYTHPSNCQKPTSWNPIKFRWQWCATSNCKWCKELMPTWSIARTRLREIHKLWSIHVYEKTSQQVGPLTFGLKPIVCIAVSLWFGVCQIYLSRNVLYLWANEPALSCNLWYQWHHLLLHSRG